MAVERDYTTKDGERKTDFIYVITWGCLAEHCNEFLNKGRLIAMQGRLEINNWKDKETGERKYRTDIIAKEVKFLDKSNNFEEEATA